MSKKYYAWDAAYSRGEEELENLSLGNLNYDLLIQSIYETVDKEYSNKIIGSKAMERLIDSYYFAVSKKHPHEDEVALEATSKLLTDEVLRLFDGDKPLTEFQRKMIIAKQNRIIEGKPEYKPKD